MSLSSLKSLEEEEDEAEGGKTKVTTSQSYPEFQTNNTLVSDPSTNNASTVTSQTIQENKTVRAPSPMNSSMLPKQSMRSSPPLPTSIIQSIADIPPPLDVQTTDNTDTKTSSLLPQKLSPLNEETKELDSVQTTQPREIKKSPRKQVSVEDIVLPPPPSLVPIVKRSNTISDGCIPHVWPIPSALADLPPPMDGNYIFRNSPAQFKTKAARSNSTSAPSLQTTRTEKQLQLQKNISNIELPPPFTMDLSLPPTMDLSLPPTMDLSSLPPTGIDLASFPPPPSSVDLSSHPPPPIVSPETAAALVIQEKKNNMSTIDMQVLLNKIPPLDPALDNLPSALDQLRYILTNDDNRQSTTIYSTKEYALLPEINKPWLSEETGIEQLRSFLQTVN